MRPSKMNNRSASGSEQWCALVLFRSLSVGANGLPYDDALEGPGSVTDYIAQSF